MSISMARIPLYIYIYSTCIYSFRDFQVAIVVKNLPANAGVVRDAGWIPRSGRSLEEGMQPTTVFLPGESHGQRSLAGYGPQGHKESDTTK